MPYPSAAFVYNPDETEAEPAVPGEPNVFVGEILAPNLSGFLAELEVMRRKALKLGIPPIAWEVGEPFKKWLASQKEETPWEVFEVPAIEVLAYPVRVVGERPQIRGWRLLGVITPLGQGVNLLTGTPDADPVALEPYRRATMLCEHCGYDRRRNETLVLQRVADGLTKQIGRDCAQDFLGRDGVDALMGWAEFDHRLSQLLKAASEDPESFSGGQRVRGLEPFLATVWGVIKDRGWVSRGKARAEGKSATVDVAMLVMKDAKDRGVPSYTPEDLAYTKDAIQRALTILAQQDQAGSLRPGYETNLYVSLQTGFVIERTAGLVASMFVFLDRRLAEDRAKIRAAELLAKGREAGYFGKKGERGTWLATVEGIFHYEGMYGPGTGVIFFLDDGNRALWFASGDQEKVEIGQRHAITATIKGHEPDKRTGVPTTLLSRVKLEDPDAAAKKVGKVKAKKEPGQAKPGSVAAMKAKLKDVTWQDMNELSAWANRWSLEIPYEWRSDREIKKLKKDELQQFLTALVLAGKDLQPTAEVLSYPVVPKITSVQVRISDNVLRDWDYYTLRIDRGAIMAVEKTHAGEVGYGHPFVPTGTFTRDPGQLKYLHEVVNWTHHDSTGRHPEEYHEVRAGEGMPWLTAATEAQLLEQVKQLNGWST